MWLNPKSLEIITMTRLCNFDPLKPHFYTVKLRFTGVYNIFLISAQNIDCGYSFEPPRRGGSNEYPQSMFWAEIWKNIRDFYLKIFSFLGVKFSIYFHVFVMETYDAHVLASSKTYRKQNKPKKWIPNPLRYMSFWQVSLSFRKCLNLYFNKDLGIKIV